MSTMTILLLCLTAGAGLHVYQILTVLAWVARGLTRRGPTVGGTLSAAAEPMSCVVAPAEYDKVVAADPPPDCAEAAPERVPVFPA